MYVPVIKDTFDSDNGCRLYGIKPLSEPMLVNCWFDHWEEISVKFEQATSMVTVDN